MLQSPAPPFSFFHALEAHGISYCHFKSNQHLLAALAGATDLDILIDAAAAPQCEKLLMELGYKHIRSPTWLDNPGVDDWLGYNAQTGAMTHLHLHRYLVVGETGAKNYRLPLEDWFLKETHTRATVRVPAIEKELVLLVTRILLKTDAVAVIRSLVRRRPSFIAKDLRAELDWLLTHSSEARLAHCASNIEPVLPRSLITDFVRRYNERRLNIPYLLQARRTLIRTLRCHRRFSAWRCTIRNIYVSCLGSRLGRALVRKRKKMLYSGSLYIAIVGADGSGKTTVTRDMQRWLGWKLETDCIYFGLPKRAVVRPLLLRSASLFSYLKKRRSNRSNRGRMDILGHLSTGIASLAWLCVAWQRYRTGKRAQALQRQGGIVIAERFPLRHFWDMREPMDGPRIPLHGPFARLARMERRLYEAVELAERVFVLKADMVTIMRRRGNGDEQTLNNKCKVINALAESESGSERFVIIDAEQSYDEVLRELKGKVWELL